VINVTLFYILLFYGFLIMAHRISEFRYNTRIAILENKILRSDISKEDKFVSKLFGTRRFDTNKEFLADESVYIRLIEHNAKKGYDFFHIVCNKPGSKVFKHSHISSNELIYCLSGDVLLKIEGRGKKSFTEKKLYSGDSALIRKGKTHSIKFIKESELIVIAKPPLFTRLGALYEKIFNKK